MEKKLTPIITLLLASILSFYIGSGQFIAIAQNGPSSQVGDALWHLPSFGKDGWFLHASNGKVRACNMDKVSVVGDRPGPRCSNWE
jgi:hypothetical protein